MLAFGIVGRRNGMRLILGLAGLALLGACADNPPPAPAPIAAPVAVAQPAAARPAAQPVAVASADKKICKTMPVTGSVTSKRVCSTQAEWDAFDKKAKEGSDKFDEQRKSGGSFRGENVPG
jgi:cytochrome c5